jgi:hypothetical protein
MFQIDTVLHVQQAAISGILVKSLIAMHILMFLKMKFLFYGHHCFCY